MKRIPLKGADEFDALTSARKYYYWKRGQLARVKRAYRKRFRQKEKGVSAVDE